MRIKVTPLLAVFLLFYKLSFAVIPPPDGGYPGGNTAEGQGALLNLTTGEFNTAIGFFSLRNNTGGDFNTGIGAGALLANTGDPSHGAGIRNTATGAGALLSNVGGGYNTANGAFALFSNADGFDNTATGVEALWRNTSGSSNTGFGDSALHSNTAGSNNTALGYQALANSTGSNNIGLGAVAGINLTTGDSNIDIDNQGIAGESNTIRIGNANHTQTFIAGIGAAALNSGTPVLVDPLTSQLGIVLSARRFKKDIKPMDKASEAILALNPVSFHYKNDPVNAPQFGLVAEEVAQVNPDLVVRDKRGEIYTVRYDQVNAMLLNEFLKEHEKVEHLESTVATLAATIRKQGAQLQKVSTQIEANGANPALVGNR